MNKCSFDKKRNFIHCGDIDRDCIGCEYEQIIARSVVAICQMCNKEISSRYPKCFCNERCRNDWLRERRSYDRDLDGGLFWGEPIFTEDDYKLVQRMLGFQKLELNV